MNPGMRCSIALLVASTCTSGCIVNSVHPLTRAQRTAPDRRHSVVVIGMGVETPLPSAELHLLFPEYSIAKKRFTGNCFHYNRIEAARPSTPNGVTYVAFEVPPNTYVYVSPFDSNLAPSSVGRAFIAPPGGTVYFGDYVFVGNRTLEFRRDMDAARAGTRRLLPRAAVLEFAESTTVEHAAGIPLCTP